MTEPSTYLGILELVPRGGGSLRTAQNKYLPDPGDVTVPVALIRQHDLRPGDELHGRISPGARPPSLVAVEQVNGLPWPPPEPRQKFSDLTVIHPREQLMLECGLQRLGRPDCTNRVIDLLCPFGKGQRALIVSPPKAGKTMVLQSVAAGIAKNYPEAKLFILLVDERPEEVVDMKSCGYGEIVSSTFDFPVEQHVRVAEMTLERARRQVELGKDVVIILDSITRLARAYNTLDINRGSKTLSGGVGAGALEKPKRFFGSARKIENGGSLTIIATALVDTGSRMDQVIFEEFKGTGNSELILDRDLANRRVFPAIDINASGTRREEELLSEAAYGASSKLRRVLGGMPTVEAMESLLQEMGDYQNNQELIRGVGGR